MVKTRAMVSPLGGVEGGGNVSGESSKTRCFELHCQLVIRQSGVLVAGGLGGGRGGGCVEDLPVSQR